MKNVFKALLLLVVGITIASCSTSDDSHIYIPAVDVYETTVSFRAPSNDPQMGGVEKSHPYEIGVGDVMLVYYLTGTDDNGYPIWSPLPAVRDMYQAGTLNVTGSLEYNFEHAPFHFLLTAKSLSGQPINDFKGNGWSFVDNVTFRVAYLMGNDPGTIRTIQADYDQGTMSYDQMVRKYNIKEADVKTL